MVMKRRRGTYYVYGLFDPRDSLLFYIGVTKDPKQRFQQHMQDKLGTRAKVKRIKELKAIGLKPMMLNLQITDGHSAPYLEKYWIQFASFLGAKLANKKHTTVNGHDIVNRFAKYSSVRTHYEHVKKTNASLKKQLTRLVEKIID